MFIAGTPGLFVIIRSNAGAYKPPKRNVNIGAGVSFASYQKLNFCAFLNRKIIQKVQEALIFILEIWVLKNLNYLRVLWCS